MKLCFVRSGQPRQTKIMSKVHERAFGAHQTEIKMSWLIRWYAYFGQPWLKIVWHSLRDVKCVKRMVQLSMCQLKKEKLVKPWPFKAWAIDLIGMILHLNTTKFILVATIYFTNWVEDIPLNTVDQLRTKVLKERIILQVRHTRGHCYWPMHIVPRERGNGFGRGSGIFYYSLYTLQCTRKWPGWNK